MWSLLLRYQIQTKLTAQARLALMCLLHEYIHFGSGKTIQLRMCDLAKLFGVHAGLPAKLLSELVEAGIIEYVVNEPEEKNVGRPVKAFKLTSRTIDSLKAICDTVESEPFFDALLGLGVCNPSEYSGRLTKGKRLLLAVLLAHADEFGVVEGLTKSSLQSLTGLTKPSITNYLKELKKEGFLDDMLPGFNFGGVLGRQSSVYFVSLSLITHPRSKQDYYFLFLDQNSCMIQLDAAQLVGLGIHLREAEVCAKWSSKLGRKIERPEVNKMAAFHANTLIASWLQNDYKVLAKIHEAISSSPHSGSCLSDILELIKSSFGRLDGIFKGPAQPETDLTFALNAPYASFEFFNGVRSGKSDEKTKRFWQMIFALACLIKALELYKVLKANLSRDLKLFIAMKKPSVGGLGIIAHSVKILTGAPEMRYMIRYLDLLTLSEKKNLLSRDRIFGVPPRWLENTL